ncbi:TonB-dependent siderophore receptor [Brevundimonas sp. Root1423]|uniref:TonB-dependent receptor n=1 Tax=Brevundimonas sp. Root1423 TaxID=1736462 RepID=UPI0006FF82D8|nr:TonB-dependent siderophore receptor [Brevundimonas sp. Root1423]KQY84896.1 TonB-dependent receptor [Brevundimonas sp. Root1423]
MTSRADALRALLFASSAAGMLMAGPALAEPGPDGEPQEATTLETITVDGRPVKREPTSPEFVAPLVDTPRSITIIPQQIIEQTAATSLQDILRTSPGITFGAGEGGQPLADRPFIRGQSSGNNVFVDGIRDSGGQQREVFNLEQVEVIKGPDSVHSGRGSGGGSINLGSKSPRLTDFTRFGLGAGTDGYLRATVDQNWHLGETAGLRINLMGSEGAVPGRDTVDYDKWGLGLSLAAGLGTSTTGTFSYYHLTSNQMPDYGIPLFTKTGVRTTDSGILDVPYNSFYGLKDRDFLTNTVDTFTFDFEHAFSENLILRNVSRYSETLNDYIVTNPGDGGAAQLIGGEWWMKRATKSRWNPVTTVANVTDLRGSFTTGGIGHEFDLGLELATEKNSNASYSTFTTAGSACPVGFVMSAANLANLGAGDCTRVYAPNTDDSWAGVINRGPISKNVTDTVGVYALDSISLTSSLILNLGVRWDQYTVNGANLTGTQANGVWTLNGQAAATPGIVVLPERQWDFVNYQIGLVYKPTANSSVYASFATASTPPTLSAGDQNASGGTGTGNLVTTVLDPEESTNFEIGAKANLFNDRLALSAAAFMLKRENAQIQTAPGVYEQAGEAEVKGIELGVSGNITRQWQVFGGYTWMDSELVSGAYNNVNVGDPLANTPEHTFSLFSTYRVTRALSLGGGVYYVSDSFGGNQGGAGGGANRIYAPEYTRVDLFASYDLTDTASLQLNVQNATDEEYIMRTNGVHHADVAPARQAILTLNLRY